MSRSTGSAFVRPAVLSLAALLASGALGCRTDAVTPSHAVFAEGKHRGMSYAHATRRAGNRGYGSDASAASLALLKDLGVNWISVTPFAFQAAPGDVTIRWGSGRISETDARLEAVTRQAHALGIRVMLKPHIWLRPPRWVGDIEHGSEVAWAAWFASYGEFIRHYARLARETGIDAFCIGNELERTTGREGEWRALIASIRDIYDGPLTYGAGADFYDVPFWDALDFMGISAYFPLVNAPSPGPGTLVNAWQPHVDRMARFAARWNRPIVFTEIGYRSADFGAWKQWEITRTAPVNVDVQAHAYQAFFDVVWPQPWFGGAYWWKWFSFPEDGGPEDNDYTPRNKPAERILLRFYGGREGPSEGVPSITH